MRRAVLLLPRILLVLALLPAVGMIHSRPALAADPPPQWRLLSTTVGLTWHTVATVCPRDGATPCAGTAGGTDLTGWVWATAPQVRDLMATVWPAIATAEPPVVTGIDGFFAAGGFLAKVGATGYVSSTYQYAEWGYGWTASSAPDGRPIGGGASYGHALAGITADGFLGLAPRDPAGDPATGVFLWRAAGVDRTPPAITPTVSGVAGTDGWYRSDVQVSWAVADPESGVTGSAGCGPRSVTTDAPATAVTCSATSAGGSSTVSVVVKRDATAPQIACAEPAPVFAQGAPGTVTATASDATSGVAPGPVAATATTATPGAKQATVSASDRAGNRTTVTCPYTVAPVTCRGKTPTHIGTAGNDTINGSPGPDVIAGLGGNDTLNGLGGDDTICGGDGNDAIRGGAGADRCSSGEVRMSSCAVIF